MNNAKASNAVVALADAMGSMAQDYESQIAQLKETNEALAKQLISLQQHSLQTDRVVGEVDAILSETLRNKEVRSERSLASMALNPDRACFFLQQELRRAPCLSPIPAGGSTGPRPDLPTSKASTPSG